MSTSATATNFNGTTEPRRRPEASIARPTNEQIARRAYEIYLSRGADHGRDTDDWLEAERQLTKELTNRNRD